MSDLTLHRAGRGPVRRVSAPDRVAWYAVLLLACPLPQAAAWGAGLYEAEVAVADRSEEARDDAFATALRDVAVKVTGLRDAGRSAALDPVVENAASYVQQFRYVEDERLQLVVGFDGRALENVMANVGLPVWRGRRPSTLVWLAIDNGRGHRRIVGSDDPGSARRIIENAAARRGIPLVLPLLDGEDRGRVTFADIWAQFDETLLKASERYPVDAILIGRARPDPGPHLAVSWTLHVGDRVERWRGRLFEGPDHTADLYAREFAAVSTPGAARAARLEVIGINSLDAYGQVLRYFRELSLISQVQVSEVRGEHVVFELSLRGDTAQLESALTLAPHLRPLRDGGDTQRLDPMTMLAYRYRP